jgi:hypothetical protein
LAHWANWHIEFPYLCAMKSMRFLLYSIALGIILTLSAPSASAQCPMCKTAVESSLKDKENTKGRGLNNGILYLLSLPYLVAGTMGVIWFRNTRKKKKEDNS